MIVNGCFTLDSEWKVGSHGTGSHAAPLPSGSPLGTAASWVFSVSGTPAPIPAHRQSRFLPAAHSPSPRENAEPFETPAAQTRSASRLPATPASVYLPLADAAPGSDALADASEGLETFCTADSREQPWSFDGGTREGGPPSRPASTPSSSGTATRPGGLRASTPGSVSSSRGDASARPRVRIMVPPSDSPDELLLVQAAASAMQQSPPQAASEALAEAREPGSCLFGLVLVCLLVAPVALSVWCQLLCLWHGRSNSDSTAFVLMMRAGRLDGVSGLRGCSGKFKKSGNAAQSAD